MPIQLTITAENPAELHARVAQLHQVFQATGTRTGAAANDVAVAPPTAPKASSNGAKKPGRPKKVVEEETTPVVAAEPAEPAEESIFGDAPTTPVVAVESVTFEDANTALHEVNTAKGINVARKLLSDFGAARISGVKESDWSKFVAAAKALTIAG